MTCLQFYHMLLLDYQRVLFMQVQSFRFSPMSQFLVTLTSTYSRIPGKTFFEYATFICFLSHSHWHLSLFHFCFEFNFLPSNSHLHLYALLMFMIHLFLLLYWLITFKFTSSIFLDTPILPNGSATVSQLPSCLPKLMIN